VQSHSYQVANAPYNPLKSKTTPAAQIQEPIHNQPQNESKYAPSREAGQAYRSSETPKNARLSSFASAWQDALQQGKGATPGSRDSINGKIDTFQESVKTTSNAKKTLEYGKKSYDAVNQAIAGQGGSASAADAGKALSGGAEAGGFQSAVQSLNKGLGPAAVVAGSLAIAQGVDKINNGQILDGSRDVVGGTGATVSGAATTASAYTSATTVAGVSLSTVAGVGGGVVAMADGAGNIIQGFKENNLEKGIVGGVKEAAGAAMMAGAITCNPFLTAGGAAAYTGALLYENRDAIADFGKKAYDTAVNVVGNS